MPILNPTLVRVAAVIAKTMHNPGLVLHIQPETTWDEINADSLDRADIFFEIECEFECELFEPACATLNTIGDLARLVDEAKGKVSA